MKRWSKRISMIIAKTASRSVAFKSGKLAESVKGVIDRRVSELYALATQDGDATLNPNGKTHAFQRNDLLKAPMNTPKTVFTLKRVNRLNRLKASMCWGVGCSIFQLRGVYFLPSLYIPTTVACSTYTRYMTFTQVSPDVFPLTNVKRRSHGI